MARTKSQLEMDFIFDTEFVTDQGLVALGVFIADMAQYVAWETGRNLTGHTVSIGIDSCSMVLKATKDGKPEVAFVNGQTALSLYRQLWVGLHKNLLVWHPDKYAKREGKD